eukprot:6463040-Amphidinium_carterae.1
MQTSQQYRLFPSRLPGGRFIATTRMVDGSCMEKAVLSPDRLSYMASTMHVGLPLSHCPHANLFKEEKPEEEKKKGSKPSSSK